MSDKTRVFSRKLSSLLGSSSKKKRILFLTFLVIAFLFVSTITSLPGSKASEIQDKFVPTSDRFFDPSQRFSNTERSNRGSEEYSSREDRGSEFSVPAYNVEFVGMWPYGACETAVVDTSRNMALIGNGYTLQVLDISEPSSLSKRGEVELEGRVQDIAISGNYAYAVTCSCLKIVDISDLNNPNEVGSIYTRTSSLQSLALSSGYAYVAAHDNGLIIYDVSDPNNLTYQATYHHDELLVDDVAIWGDYAICECAYLMQDTSPTDYPYGVEVVDVSDPSAPFLTGTYQTEESYYLQGMAVSGDGYVYTCQYSDIDETCKIIVVDVVSDPLNPTEIGSYVESNRDFEGVAHSGNYAYLHDRENSRLVTLDISNPSAPYLVGECETIGDFRDINISGSFVGIAHGDGGFSLYDVSNPGSPSPLGNYDTPDEALGRGTNPIVALGNYVYLACGRDGLRIMDVSDPSNPFVAGTWVDIDSIHSIAISGRYAYFCRGWPRHFKIVDISNPSNPYLVTQFEFPSDDYELFDIAVCGDYAYVSGNKWMSGDPYGCLTVVDISDPTDPEITGSYVHSAPTFNTGGVAVSGNYAYLSLENWSQVGDYRSSLRIIDISDPTDPTEVGSYFSDDHSSDVAVRGDYVYLAGGSFRIIDVTNPENPEEIFSSGWRWGANCVALSGDYAYLECLRVIDVSDPHNPQSVGRYFGGGGSNIAVSGSYAYTPGSLFILRNLLAPEVSIADPSTSSTLHGSVSIEALASHSSSIDRVEFYIDDSISSFDTTSPYTSTWDTTSVADGPHKIRARAYNNNGKSSDSEIEVTVRNQCHLSIFYSSGGMTDPDTGTHSYNYGTEVSITAIPDSDYKFSGWTGDVTGGYEMDNPVTVAMDSDKSITANFIKQHTLTISAGTGGTTYPVPESHTYDVGTEVSLTAIPDSGYRFSRWTGDVPGGLENDNPLMITVDSDKSITANFEAISPDEGEAGEKKGPCFIATAAYGSPLHPHLDILRDFRDKYLIPTQVGRWVVECYYKYSPSLADLISKHKALKVGVRINLFPIVAFSYALLNLGPVISATLLLFILGFPLFFVVRKEKEAKRKKEDEGITMMDRKPVISHKLNQLLLDLGSKRKRVVFLMFLGIAFLLSSSITSTPGSKASEIENKIRQSHVNVELVGRWPYGTCEGSAVDTSRSTALIGNGYTLQVLDISVPTSLSKIGEVELEGRVQDIEISGNYAYVVTQSYLKIVDISDLNNPNEVGSEYFEGASLLSVAISSGYAYVAAHYNGLYIFDVSNPSNPTFQESYYHDVIDVHDNFEVHDVAVWDHYAICDCMYRWVNEDTAQWIYEEQVQVIDISNPLAPFLEGSYQTEESYSLKGIDVSGDGYVYTCQYSETDETSKIVVIDVATNPASPAEMGSYIESDREFEGVTLSGNYAYVYAGWWPSWLIALDISDPSSPYSIGECEAIGDFYGLGISGNFVGISHGDGGFSLYDVSNPASPSQLGNYDTPHGVFGRHGSPIVVSGDYAYLAGMRIMDISDPSNPFLAGVGGADDANSVAISGRFAYCCAGWPRHFKIVDISSPTNPYQVASLGFPDEYQLFDVAVRGDYAYVSGVMWISDDPYAYLRVVDVSNPMNPHIVGSYDSPVISFNSGGIALSGDYVYLVVEDWSLYSDLSATLRIIDISDPTDPTEVGSYFAGSVETVTTGPDGTYSHTVSHNWSGTVIPSMEGYEFSPSNRQYAHVSTNQENQDYTATLKSTYVSSQPTDVAPDSRYLFSQETIATGISRQDPPPTISGAVKTEGGTGIEGVTITFLDVYDYSAEVVVRGDYAYLAGGKVRIIDVSNPANPSEINSYPIGSNSVALSGNCLYLDNLRLLDISDPYNLGEPGRYYGEGGVGIAVSGNHAYVAGSLCILKNERGPEVSISNPSAWESLHGAVSIEVLASHSSGINKVEFYIDDELRSTDSTSAFSYTWNTTFEEEGLHRIRAQAYNNEGYSSDSEIEVTVRNQCHLNIFYSSGGVTTPDTGTYSYDYGTEVSLTAIPDNGYRFTGWTGDVPEGQENDNPLMITVDSDKSVTANFIKQWTLNLSAGTGGTTDPAPGSYTHDEGIEVSLTAIPDSGYRFSGWSGDASGSSNSITITMDSDKSVTANFIKQWTLNLSAGTGGTTDPAPGSYTHDEGTEVSLTAIPDSGYKFSGWSGDASGSSNSITITMDSDKSVTANFSAISTDEDEPEEKTTPCFIATAAYGSPLHPHLDILRDFRDHYLMPSKFGRRLVECYYRYSPSVADLIAKHKALKVVVRASLLPLVAFSYSLLHLGPIITASMILSVLGFPVCLALLFRRKTRKRKFNHPKQ